MYKNLGVFLAICLFNLIAFAQNDPTTLTKVNQQVPDFAIKDINGKEFKIAEQKGKVVLIYLWTTWCPYCKLELEVLETEVWQKLKNSKDFVFIAIAREETDAEINKYLEKNKLTMTLASDPKGDVFKLFGTSGVPRSYLIDPQGKIIAQTLGIDLKAIEKRQNLLIKELLKLEKADKNKSK